MTTTYKPTKQEIYVAIDGVYTSKSNIDIGTYSAVAKNNLNWAPISKRKFGKYKRRVEKARAAGIPISEIATHSETASVSTAGSMFSRGGYAVKQKMGRFNFKKRNKDTIPEDIECCPDLSLTPAEAILNETEYYSKNSLLDTGTAQTVQDNLDASFESADMETDMEVDPLPTFGDKDFNNLDSYSDDNDGIKVDIYADDNDGTKEKDCCAFWPF